MHERVSDKACWWALRSCGLLLHTLYLLPEVGTVGPRAAHLMNPVVAQLSYSCDPLIQFLMLVVIPNHKIILLLLHN